MKSLPTQIIYFLRQRPSQISFVTFLRFLLLVVTLIAVYSTIFHVLMLREQQSHSWITGVYWTLTVMSTLGFGDITFNSDAGRFFSIIVLISGIVFLLILFPFTFMEFFYTPWTRAQAEARTPRHLPKTARGHVILTHFDPITEALIRRLRQKSWPYVLLVSDIATATELFEQGYKVVRGDLDDPQSYVNARADQAVLVATTANDRVNTNVVATIREVTERVPVSATADVEASVDVLALAGCTHVIQVAEMMGQALGQRAINRGALVQELGKVEGIRIAEVFVSGTSLEGMPLAESRLRELHGLNVIGSWVQGRFTPSHPDMILTEGLTLIVASSAEQLQQYRALSEEPDAPAQPVVIIGGGRVGRATARALAARGIDYRIVERMPERAGPSDRYVIGDAADIEVLTAAGLLDAPSIIITTHDDDTNIYLTIYCRRLRPDAQIISRAVLERNVATMHRGGANFVISYASLGATAIINLLDNNSLLVFEESLDIFSRPIPRSLVNKSLAEADLRATTGCNVIGVRSGVGEMQINPDPAEPLPAHGELLIIGTPEAAESFQKQYGRPT